MPSAGRVDPTSNKPTSSNVGKIRGQRRTRTSEASTIYQVLVTLQFMLSRPEDDAVEVRLSSFMTAGFGVPQQRGTMPANNALQPTRSPAASLLPPACGWRPCLSLLVAGGPRLSAALAGQILLGETPQG